MSILVSTMFAWIISNGLILAFVRGCDEGD